MTWNKRDDGPDSDDYEESDLPVEEEEKADAHPTLGGTAALARVVFLGLLALVILGGVLAFVRALGSWLGK